MTYGDDRPSPHRHRGPANHTVLAAARAAGLVAHHNRQPPAASRRLRCGYRGAVRSRHDLASRDGSTPPPPPASGRAARRRPAPCWASRSPRSSQPGCRSRSSTSARSTSPPRWRLPHGRVALASSQRGPAAGRPSRPPRLRTAGRFGTDAGDDSSLMSTVDPHPSIFWFASRAFGIVADTLLLGISVALGLAMSGRL